MLVGIRGAAWLMVDAAKRAGLTAGAALFFDDPRKRDALVRTLAQPGDAILFKGSRGVHVERALEEFLNQARSVSGCSTGYSYEKLFHYLFAVPRVSILDVPHGDGELTAMLLSIVLGPWLIARLRQFQIGQHIREDGPQSHHKKAGTPTMGGLLICVSIVVPTLLWSNLRDPAVWVALAGLVSFGAVGFLDDYHENRATSAIWV